MAQEINSGLRKLKVAVDDRSYVKRGKRWRSASSVTPKNPQQKDSAPRLKTLICNEQH